MLDELVRAKKVVGFKQTVRSIEDESAKKVFLAKDVSPDIFDNVANLCKIYGIEIEYVETMRQLGTACKIDVPAAVAALLND